MTTQQHRQFNNLVITVSSNQALIDKVFFQASQYIFKSRMQYLNQVKTQGFRTLQFRDFQ